MFLLFEVEHSISLAIQTVSSEDSDQTAQMCGLI